MYITTTLFDRKEGFILQTIRIRIGAILLAAILLFSLTACGGAGDNLSEITDQTTTPTTAPTTAPPVRYENLLTGEKELETTQNRPVAFMIGNYSYTSGYLQQEGIDKADFYVEAETEGGIPRIMAVFGSIEKVPAEVGPVRSARTHFVKMAKALDTIYCHVGGSTLGKAMIRQKGVTDLDGLTQVSSKLKAANGNWNEHIKVFPIAKINSAIKSRGIRTTTSTKSPYTFGSKAGDTKAEQVQVAISSAYLSSFTYDATTGLYTKHRKALSTEVHKSVDGDPIQVKNVIIMYDKQFKEDAGHISYTLESGSGIYVSNGLSRQIRWSRTDSQLSFKETDGTPLTVNPGKTYICLTATGQAGKTVLQ